MKRGMYYTRGSSLACFLVLLLSFGFHERVIRCSQSFQVRFFFFSRVNLIVSVLTTNTPFS
jgi:hypothetical protein